MCPFSPMTTLLIRYLFIYVLSLLSRRLVIYLLVPNCWVPYTPPWGWTLITGLYLLLKFLCLELVWNSTYKVFWIALCCFSTNSWFDTMYPYMWTTVTYLHIFFHVYSHECKLQKRFLSKRDEPHHLLYLQPVTITVFMFVALIHFFCIGQCAIFTYKYILWFCHIGFAWCPYIPPLCKGFSFFCSTSLLRDRCLSLLVLFIHNFSLLPLFVYLVWLNCWYGD